MLLTGTTARRTAAVLLTAGLALPATSAHSAGFAIIEHSAQGMGNAYAGGAANGEDLSVLWFNPAGIVNMPGTQSQLATHLIVPEFDGNASSSLVTPGGNLPRGSRGSDGGTLALVPATYFSHQFSDRIWAGIAVNAPFGLATNYDDDWAGRYHAIDSEILTFNVGPSVAFKASEKLSIGVGFDLMYFDAKLTNAIDTNGAIASGLGAQAAAQAAAGNLAAAQALQAQAGAVLAGPQLPDSRSKNEADGFGVGFNVGLLFEPVSTKDKEVRFGVHYRSPVNHDLDGRASFRRVGPLAAAPNLADDDISVKLKLPPKISASYYHRVRQVAFMGDVTWTGWSTLPELKISYDGIGPFGNGEAIEEVNFEDSWRVSAGLAYYYNSRWTWRGGVAWDQSPTRSSSDRTARLPDNNRLWFSAGLGYQFNDKLSIDVGVAHLLIGDTSINRTNASGSFLTGSFDSEAQIVSAQGRYRF